MIEVKKVSKDVGLLSRTSIYLSRPKKNETEQPKAPRKHRLPANSNGNLTK